MPLVYKQALAIIDSRTTVICLDVHGVVVPVDAPFETLAGDFQAPPFHVHCRTLVGPHMPGFISAARKAANTELVKRPMKERRKGPDGPAGSIPGPTTDNPPSGFSRRDEELDLKQQDLLFENERKLKDAGKGAGAEQDPWGPTTVEPAKQSAPLSKDDAAAMIDRHPVLATDEERTAVGLYKAGMTWSQDLRQDKASDYTMERVNQVRSINDRQVPLAEPIAVYRGMSRQFLPDGFDQPGTVFKDKGFTSTSLDRETAELFKGSGALLEIIVPKGARVLPVNHAMMHDDSRTPAEYRLPFNVLGSESEILLMPGSEFEVVGKKKRLINGSLVEVLQVNLRSASAESTPDRDAPEQEALTGLLAQYRKGYKGTDDHIWQGNRAEVEIGTVADGTKVVRKKVTTEEEADKEHLAGLIANALGIKLETAKVGPQELVTEYVDGLTGNGWLKEHAKDFAPDYTIKSDQKRRDALSDAKDRAMVTMAGGKEIGLLDFLIENPDRHPGNWMIRDGHVYPIDHGNSKFSATIYDDYDSGKPVELFNGSPFSVYWLGAKLTKYGEIRSLKPSTHWTKAELQEHRDRLAALVPEFTQYPRWLEYALAQMDRLIGMVK